MIKRLYKKIVPERTRIQVRERILMVMGFLYAGNNFHCNCCNKSFRKFYSKGYESRVNAQCPSCGSLERTRLLKFYLERETDIFDRHLRVLHIAPESTLFSILSKLDIEYIDGDINSAYARHVVDLTDIQFPDNHFDLIICSHVLGHIPDEEQAVKEMKRVLKSDGKAIIMTLLNLKQPTFEDPSITSAAEKLGVYGEPDLCRLHGSDMTDRLAKSGLMVELIDYRTHLSQDLVETHRLGDGRRELIFACRKPRS